MSPADIASLLVALGSADDHDRAWAEFLEHYAPLLLQVSRVFARNDDEAGHCFLFQCERLRANRCARLRRFNPGGRASFPTWLRAVARNLSLDWYRAQRGRRRPFAFLAGLPFLHRETFRLVFQERLSIDEAAGVLRAQIPRVERDDVAAAQEELWRQMTLRQRRALADWTAQGREQPLQLDPDADIQNGDADPEQLAVFRETRRMLAGGLRRLTARERLVLRLRFDEELTLAEIARLLGLKDAQSVDRWIRDLLARLRRDLT